MHVPIYFNYGNKDPVVKPELSAEALNRIKSSGYKRVRSAVYDGVHAPSPEQVRLGLEWFQQEATK